MGSSVEDPNKDINGSASGLVWVQRRNGSWWPGQILGPDELPEGSVPTTNSETPVKLLGKEDSTVDWYNLEKSKRVKAFHCGDHNLCIEKVKASASNNLFKKSTKYSKRDGAILLALELESAFLGKDHELPPAFYRTEDFGENSFSSKDYTDSEDNGDKCSKRMRGLDDLGTKVASSLKRKITRISNNQEFLKRKKRRRALTKVLECTTTTMVSVPVVERLSSPHRVSLLECNGSKKSNGISSEGKREGQENEICDAVRDTECLGRLFDVPLVDEENGSTALPSINSSQQTQVSVRTQSSRSSHVETSSLVNEENNEPGPTSSGGALYVPISPGTEECNPEWRSKGKRNSRSRKVDPLNEAVAHVAFSRRDVGPIQPVQQLPQKLPPYHQSRSTVNPGYDHSDFSIRDHIAGPCCLYDVPLEVKSSHEPHHVPYISLTSELTGRSVVGQPLPVEFLDDGSCDGIISVSECYYNLNEQTTALEGGDRVHARKPPGCGPRNKKHRCSGLLSRSLKSRKYNRLMSKKTRKLSSLGGAHGLSRDKKKPLAVEKLKGPSIACVPLKVVFSRINADLSGSGRTGSRPIVTVV